MKKSLFLSLLLSVSLASCSLAGDKHDKEVLKAFHLRMDGRVDQAKALLDSLISADSTNAMAFYELARLNHYKLTGGGGTTFSDIITPIDKAAALEPKNATYAYYKALASFLNAFMYLQQGQGDVKAAVEETASNFEKVLAIKPDYGEAMLYLVDIYGQLPPEMGGDRIKAEDYAKKLAIIDRYLGFKAEADLVPEGTDMVKYWEELLADAPDNPSLMMEAGKACLFAVSLENAERYFDQAMRADPSKNILLLDLGRYHMMKVMQNQELAATELPEAIKCFERYLASSPEPIIPMKAFTLGLISIIARFQGHEEEAGKLLDEASALDPYFSRAMGVPTQLLFDPPDQISHHYFSFFSWF